MNTEDEIWGLKRTAATRQDYDAKVLQSIVGHPQWRLGQTLFNVLSDVRPDLAQQVRGTEHDPFYKASNDLELFYAFLDSHWPRQ